MSESIRLDHLFDGWCTSGTARVEDKVKGFKPAVESAKAAASTSYVCSPEHCPPHAGPEVHHPPAPSIHLHPAPAHWHQHSDPGSPSPCRSRDMPTLHSRHPGSTARMTRGPWGEARQASGRPHVQGAGAQPPRACLGSLQLGAVGHGCQGDAQAPHIGGLGGVADAGGLGALHPALHGHVEGARCGGCPLGQDPCPRGPLRPRHHLQQVLQELAGVLGTRLGSQAGLGPRGQGAGFRLRGPGGL